MFLISQEVLAQQLLNDEAALLNETKRFAFSLCHDGSGPYMEYSAHLHGLLLLIFSAVNACF